MIVKILRISSANSVFACWICFLFDYWYYFILFTIWNLIGLPWNTVIKNSYFYLSRWCYKWNKAINIQLQFLNKFSHFGKCVNCTYFLYCVERYFTVFLQALWIGTLHLHFLLSNVLILSCVVLFTYNIYFDKSGIFSSPKQASNSLNALHLGKGLWPEWLESLITF